jgi:hypothetical protein
MFFRDHLNRRNMGYKIVTLVAGDPLYRRVFDRIEADTELNRASEQFAESPIAQHPPRPDPLTGEPGWPGRCWWMALTEADVAMAWAAAQMTWREVNGMMQPFVLARNSFHVPDFYGIDIYPQVFAAREKAIGHLPGETFVFEQILQLHLAAGWVVFDEGVSKATPAQHRWWGLKRGW